MDRSSNNEALAAAMLALLPEDGTPVLNRALRVMLARRLEQAIDDTRFFAARDALLAAGKVGRLRGQGGQVFLTTPAAPSVKAPPQAAATDPWSEARLMAPLRRFLEGPFRIAVFIADFHLA